MGLRPILSRSDLGPGLFRRRLDHAFGPDRFPRPRRRTVEAGRTLESFGHAGRVVGEDPSGLSVPAQPMSLIVRHTNAGHRRVNEYLWRQRKLVGKPVMDEPVDQSLQDQFRKVLVERLKFKVCKKDDVNDCQCECVCQDKRQKASTAPRYALSGQEQDVYDRARAGHTAGERRPPELVILTAAGSANRHEPLAP